MANKNKIVFEEVAESEIGAEVQKVLGSTPARLLRFRKAVLARAEVNKNNDAVDDTGINELAASLPLCPVDVEHDRSKVVGMYLAAENARSALSTSGLIHADRFPDIVQGLASGQLQFSVDATANEAECSMCHQVFASMRDYCDHLKNRLSGSGAVRILRGLKAVGGSVVKRPAGTDTKADPSQMEFIANVVMASDLNPPKPDPEPEPEPVPALTNEEAAAQFLKAAWGNLPTGGINGKPHDEWFLPVISPYQYVETPEFVEKIVQAAITKYGQQMMAEFEKVIAASATTTREQLATQVQQLAGLQIKTNNDDLLGAITTPTPPAKPQKLRIVVN